MPSDEFISADQQAKNAQDSHFGSDSVYVKLPIFDPAD
jgi:hypothetical protein